jgi:3-dehydroquinate synthase
MGGGISMILGKKKVTYGSNSYPILLAKDFTGLREELNKIPKVSNYIVITEKPIAKIYKKQLDHELDTIPENVHYIYIKGGEKNKHIDRIKKIYHRLVDLGVDRKAVILALGGGVVGDFAGFIAATYQRGIRFVQIPTTLLACVDSSVGGKVAVNIDKGKNMVGCFHQPELVFIPSFVLDTLPSREWSCGLAEILKHSLLAGGEMWKDFSSHSRKDIDSHSKILQKMILDSVAFKAGIVAEDEKEAGLRQILNLGHTTAHAIESLTKYKKYSHGEAVAIGLVTALLLSEKHSSFPKERIDKIATVMDNYQLPISDSSKIDTIIEHMEHDKKKVGSSLMFVVLEDIGKPLYGVAIPREGIADALKKQRKI